MAAPDPESFGLLEKVFAGLAAVGVPIWGARTWLERRFARKADKEQCEKDNANCLRHIEKLYENAEEDRKLTRDLHDKAMQGIADGQRTIIEMLSRR